MPALKELIAEVEAGFYVIPEIQRSFVWRDPQIKDLTSSIYNNFPIGSLIIWEMPQSFVDDYADLFRPLADGLPDKNGRYMVIDGQQRLVSLLLINKGELSIGGGQRKIDLYFNPQRDQFALERRTELRGSPEWFNVVEIITANNVQDVLAKKAQVTGDTALVSNPLLVQKLYHLKYNLDTYEVTLVKAKLGYGGDFLELFEKISQIFVVLNSKGTRIRLPDLVLALMTGRVRREAGYSFRDKVGKIIQDMESKAWEIDETVLMRLYMAITTGTTKFTVAKDTLDRTDTTQLLSALEITKDTLVDTVDLLRKDIGIKSPDQFQSKYLLVPIVYLLYKDSVSARRMLTEASKRELARWLILASVQERYTGRLESQLGEDIADIADGKGPPGLIENLEYKELSEARFVGDYEKYHLALLSTLYTVSGARDWDLKAIPQPPPLNALSPTDLTVHHIFPRDFLKQHYRGKNSLDDAANITLVSRRANESIGKKAPKEYLREIFTKDPELLKRHFVPLDQNLWEAHSYDVFLKERRDLILHHVENDLQIKVTKAL